MLFRSRISALFHYNLRQAAGRYYVDDQTAKDLDLEDIFAEIDHTNSRIGEQVLYNMLRLPAGSVDELASFDQFVKQVTGDEENRIACQKQLSKMKHTQDYHIVDFLFFDIPPNPSWVRRLWLLQCFFYLAVATSFFYPLAVVLIMAIFCVNFVIHYRTKNKFHSFYVALGRIGTLYTVSQKLLKLDVPAGQDIVAAVKKCRKIIKKFWVFDLNNLYYSEMTKPFGVAIELIKIATLLEVKATYKICRRFSGYRGDLLKIYHFVGTTDAAISVGSFRKSLPYYCIPEIQSRPKYIALEEVYHPLIKNGVANSLCTGSGRSLFINGTNMSGKTTFIRTLGINMILARSIRTCLARHASISPFDVYTSIRIEDDVEAGISYYFQELLRLKEFVQTAGQSGENTLFLIDEILKGTNIYDRTRIAKSILSFLTRSPHVLAMVTSHDIDLAAQLQGMFDFYFFTETVNDNDLKFDYKIRQGLSTERNAVKLLSLLDFPKEIIEETKQT